MKAKNHRIKNIRNLSLILFQIFSFQAFSQSLTVKKVKGNQAVVETSAPLELGRTYFINPNGELSSDLANESREGLNSKTAPSLRSNSISFEAAAVSLTRSSTNQTSSATAISLAYGWNKVTYEFGPLVAFINEASSTTTYLGGFFEYNFSKNKWPITSIFSVGGQMKYSFSDYSSAIEMNPGVIWKWFAFRDTSINSSLQYYYKSYSPKTGSSYNDSGPKLGVEFRQYF